MRGQVEGTGRLGVGGSDLCCRALGLIHHELQHGQRVLRGRHPHSDVSAFGPFDVVVLQQRPSGGRRAHFLVAREAGVGSRFVGQRPRPVLDGLWKQRCIRGLHCKRLMNLWWAVDAAPSNASLYYVGLPLSPAVALSLRDFYGQIIVTETMIVSAMALVGSEQRLYTFVGATPNAPWNSKLHMAECCSERGVQRVVSAHVLCGRGIGNWATKIIAPHHGRFCFWQHCLPQGLFLVVLGRLRSLSSGILCP